MSSSTTAGPEVHALSCVNCRQRKVKCAKTYPCPHCVRGGLECIFPSRKKDRAPRRSKNHELLNRLAKLEAIVGQADPALIARTAAPAPAPATAPSPSSLSAHRQQQTSREVDGGGGGVEGQARDAQKRPSVTEPTSKNDPAAKYVSGEFWANLSTEVEGIKAALDQPSESDDDDGYEDGSEDASPESGGGGQGAHSSPSTYIASPAIFGNAHAAGAAEALRHPPPERIKKLRELYFRNVDPLIKILHRPTIEREFDVFMINPEDNPLSRSTEALYFAMYFAAVTSLQPEDCRQQLGEDRGPLAVQYRQAVELALARADYLNNTSLESLQALTLYDTCLRNHAESRASWALLALVYRLAQAMGLHRDGTGSAFPPYEAEMRRRLWSQLVVLDVRAAQDRGSEPMVREDDVNTMAPTNVDDAAFHRGTSVPVPQLAVEGPTDFTFSLCTYRCSSLFLYIHTPRTRFAKSSSSSSFLNDQQQQQQQEPLPGGVPPPQMTQTSEEDIVARIKALEAQFVAPAAAHPGHYPAALAAAVVRLTTLIFWLTIQYPFRVRQPAALAHRPRVSREHMLQAAVAVIELQAFGPAVAGSGLDPADARARFQWWQDGYVQWHPLAVALAELCVQTEGPLADRAWRTVDRVFPAWRHKVADERRGALWRPIRKLHRRARERRAEAQLRRLRIDAGEDPAAPPAPPPPPPPTTAAPAPTVPAATTTTTEQQTRKSISPLRAAIEVGPTGIPLSTDFGDIAMDTGTVTGMTAEGPGTSSLPLPVSAPTTSTPADPEMTEPPAIIYNNAHHQWTIDFGDLGQQDDTAGVAASSGAMMMMDPEQQQQGFDLMDWSAWNDFVNDANIDNKGFYGTSPSSEGK